MFLVAIVVWIHGNSALSQPPPQGIQRVWWWCLAAIQERFESCYRDCSGTIGTGGRRAQFWNGDCHALFHSNRTTSTNSLECQIGRHDFPNPSAVSRQQRTDRKQAVTITGSSVKELFSNATKPGGSCQSKTKLPREQLSIGQSKSMDQDRMWTLNHNGFLVRMRMIPPWRMHSSSVVPDARTTSLFSVPAVVVVVVEKKESTIVQRS